MQRPFLRILLLVALMAAIRPLAAAAETRIVAFGDSLVSGYGLPEAQGFAPRLEAWLRANGVPDAVVVNAGVAGETTGEARRRVGRAVAPGTDAVIVVIGGNDILRDLPLAEMRRNLDAILSAIDRPVLVAGLPAPPWWPQSRRKALREMYHDVARAHGARLERSFLAGLGEGRDMRGVMALLQPDGLHPNAAGVEAIVAHIGPKVRRLVRDARREGR